MTGARELSCGQCGWFLPGAVVGMGAEGLGAGVEGAEEGAVRCS